MKSLKFGTCCISLLSLSSALTSQAHAQGADQTLDPQASVAGDIVVTARKRSESILDVPASISAFSSEKLVAIGANTVSDLQNSIPNLQYTQRGDLTQQVSIRGIGGDPRSIGIESGVGLYVDQVFVGRTGGYNQDLSNVSQIEILRGPQGTLFGKNTIGGVINITTRKPGDELEGGVSASYGNYSAFVIKGNVSGPITSNFFVGVSAASNTRQGYIRNLFDGQRLQDINRVGGRVQARWLPMDNLEINWSADRTTSDIDFALAVPASPATGPAIPYATGDSRFKVMMDQSNHSALESTGASQTIDYTITGGPTITAITGYRKTEILLFSDADGLPIDNLHSGPFTDNSTMFSQELRLTSPSSGRFRYVAGLYYFDQDANADRSVFIAGSLVNGFRTSTRIDTKAYAAFANFDFDITSGLTATAGVRYTKETKKGSHSQLSNLGGGRNYSFPSLSRSDQDVSWTASLNYQFTDGLSSYATVSRGFKSGGFNVDPITVLGYTVDRLSYAPETVVNYEIGAKGRVFDGALTFSAAVFRSDYSDKQVNQILPGLAVIAVQITNAGKAQVKGFELEASIKPDDYWTIDLGGSVLDAKYTKFDNAAAVGGTFVSYTGNVLEYAPKSSAIIAVTRRQPVGSGDLIARVNYRYTGSTYFQPDNNPLHLQGGYSLFDARLGFESASKKFSVAIWGKNLTDESYYVFSRVQGGVHQVLYGEPRTYGIETSFKF